MLPKSCQTCWYRNDCDRRNEDGEIDPAYLNPNTGECDGQQEGETLHEAF